MRYPIIRDLLVIILSIIIAVLLIRWHILEIIIYTFRLPGAILAFIAGIFYVSVFTAPLAIAMLIELAQAGFLWQTIILGGLGAVLGDLVIFEFFKFGIIKNLRQYLKKRKYHLTSKAGLFYFLSSILGMVIIASPLPDELGIFLMGTSRTKTKTFALLSLILNTIGIAFIVMATKALTQI